jgi:hypothetical protein
MNKLSVDERHCSVATSHHWLAVLFVKSKRRAMPLYIATQAHACWLEHLELFRNGQHALDQAQVIASLQCMHIMQRTNLKKLRAMKSFTLRPFKLHLMQIS